TVALITGGNKGIGKGIAQAFAAEGAALALTARGKESLSATAAEFNQPPDARLRMAGGRDGRAASRGAISPHDGAFWAARYSRQQRRRVRRRTTRRVVNRRVGPRPGRESAGAVPVHARGDADHEETGRRTHHQHRLDLGAARATRLGAL